MLIVFDPQIAAVTVTVDGTEWSSTVNRVLVQRNATGAWEPIRGYGSGSRAAGGGSAVASDNEMPLHSTVQYRVQGYNGTTLVQTLTGSVSTEVAECLSFLKKAGDVNATVRVEQHDTVVIDSSTQGGVYDVAGGQSIAVAAWAGVNADRFTFTAQTSTTAETAALLALLKTRVLLFQPCMHEFYPPGWYFIESVNRALRDAPLLNPGFRWTLSLVRTSVPSGDSASVAGKSYLAVRAAYPTYADLTGTYFDVLAG